MKKPLILMILDGFGIGTNFGNAIREANKPNMEKIFSTNPTTLIAASGMDVGLPDGQMGNSEVGHTNMGAGRVVYQELTRISKAIKEGTVYDNEVLVKAMNNAADDGNAKTLRQPKNGRNSLQCLSRKQKPFGPRHPRKGIFVCVEKRVTKQKNGSQS